MPFTVSASPKVNIYENNQTQTVPGVNTAIFAHCGWNPNGRGPANVVKPYSSPRDFISDFGPKTADSLFHDAVLTTLNLQLGATVYATRVISVNDKCAGASLVYSSGSDAGNGTYSRVNGKVTI